MRGLKMNWPLVPNLIKYSCILISYVLHFPVYSMFFMIPFVFFMLVLILVNTID